MFHRRVACEREATRQDWQAAWLPFLPFILLAVTITLNPVGFIGGDADDLRYVEAARCWVSNGPCLPADHWEGRWPTIAPLAAAISLLGEGRWTVALPSLIASFACVALVYRLGRQLFGATEAVIAASLLAIVPAFALQALDPNVDSIELAFVLGGFVAMLRGRKGGVLWPALCGLSFGLAVQSRETALAIAPLALVAFALVHPPGRHVRPWLIAGAAFALPFIVEAIIFAAQTGDPFWRRRLSLGHSQLATTELQGRSQVGGLPFFNRELIENWRREPGLSLHWTIDGLLNLIVNPRTGGIFILLPFLWVMCRNQLSSRQRRLFRLLALGTITYAVIIIYMLAMDPKPRIMLPAIAAAVLALGPLLAALLRERKTFTTALLVGVALICVVNILSGYRSDRAERIIAAWIEQDGDRIETARQTFRRLAFQPDAGKLAPLISDRPLLMLQVNNSCGGWLDDMRIDRAWLPVVRSASLGTYPASMIEKQTHLCLYRYGDTRAHQALLRALGAREIYF